jgi:hypothetical protein
MNATITSTQALADDSGIDFELQGIATYPAYNDYLGSCNQEGAYRDAVKEWEDETTARIEQINGINIDIDNHYEWSEALEHIYMS